MRRFCIFCFRGACFILEFHSFDLDSGHQESFISGKSVTFENDRVPYLLEKRTWHLLHMISRPCAYLIFSVFCEYWKLFWAWSQYKSQRQHPLEGNFTSDWFKRFSCFFFLHLLRRNRASSCKISADVAIIAYHALACRTGSLILLLHLRGTQILTYECMMRSEPVLRLISIDSTLHHLHLSVDH